MARAHLENLASTKARVAGEKSPLHFDALAVLALSHHHLGHEDEAASLLEEAILEHAKNGEHELTPWLLEARRTEALRLRSQRVSAEAPGATARKAPSRVPQVMSTPRARRSPRREKSSDQRFTSAAEPTAPPASPPSARHRDPEREKPAKSPGSSITTQ